jgi:hypothetical protein
MICPAYQSAFIYDQEALRKKFSYFKEDSTPKMLMASKSKYLIAEEITYQKKNRSLQTVEMKPVFPIVPDSLRDDFNVSLAELDSAAQSIIDSTYIVDVDKSNKDLDSGEDSIYVITKDKELRLLKYNPDSMKYSVVNVRLNVDQDNYMWYLRDYLILPDVRLAKLQGAANKEAKAKKEKKGFFGFFKNLFGKKKKDKVDSAKLVPAKGAHDFDYVDTLAYEKTVVDNEKTKKKGGLFSSKKEKKAKRSTQPRTDKVDAIVPEEKPTKKKKKKSEDTEPEDDAKPARMEEEKDDGF